MANNAFRDLRDLLNRYRRTYGDSISNWPENLKQHLQSIIPDALGSMSDEERNNFPEDASNLIINALYGGFSAGPQQLDILTQFANRKFAPPQQSQFESVKPRQTPVNPSGLNALGEGRSSLDEFQAMLNAQFAIDLGDKGFDFKSVQQNDFLRIAIQKGTQDPIYMDLRPGPMTVLESGGVPSIEMISPSGWVTNIGAQIYLPEVGSPQMRNPFEALVQYVSQAYSGTAYGRDPNERFRSLLAYGGVNAATGAGVVGGLLGYGRHHTEAVKEDMARRVAIGFGTNIKDTNTAIQSILSEMEDPQASQNWQALRGLAPYKGDNKDIWLVPGGQLLSSGDIMGVGKDPFDMMKRRQVVLGMRETAELTRLGPGGRTLEIAKPSYIEDDNAAGYKYLNVTLPGETSRRSAIIRPNALMTGGFPFPGSQMIYQDPTDDLFSAAYTGQQKIEFPQLPMTHLLQSKIQWGRFQAEKDDEGNIVGYKEQFRAGKPYPLEGQYIEGGTTAIVGLVSYPGEEGNQIQMPITLSAQGKGLFVRGAPTWNLPPEYSPGLGYGFPGVYTANQEIPSDIRKTEGILPQLQQVLGGNVQVGTEQYNVTGYLPTGQITGLSGKTYTKHIPMYPARTAAGNLYPRINVGDSTAIISAMSGEMKSPLAFVGEFGSWSRERQIRALGEFGGDVGQRLQTYASSVPGRQALQSRDLARSYYQKEYMGFSSEIEFFDELRGRIEALPQDVQWERYGRAKIENLTWMPMGAVTSGERWMLQRQFYHAALLANEGQRPKNFSQLYNERMRFRQVEGRENLYEWDIAMRGQIVTEADFPTPEFRYKMPIFGFEEMAALDLLNPAAARRLGLSLSQGPEATGLMPTHAQAWRQVSDVARYSSDERLQGLPPITHTVLSDEQKAQLNLLLNTENFTISDLERTIGGGAGPLYNPNTGVLLERPSAVQGISTFELEDTEAEMAVARFARFYPEALREFIFDQMPNAGRQQDLGVLRSNVFSSKGGGVNKLLAGRFSPNILGGRYNAQLGQGLSVSIMTQEAMDQVIRQMSQAYGDDSQRYQDLIRSQIEAEGFIPGFVQRDPTVARRGGVSETFFTTPAALFKHTGVRVPEGSRFDNGQGIGGRVGATGWVASLGLTMIRKFGDWDADPAKILLNMELTKNGISISDAERWQGENIRSVSELVRQIESEMAGQMGVGSGVPAGKLSVVANAMFDLWPELGGDPKNIAMPKSGRSTSITTARDLFNAGLDRLRLRGGMGISYNMRRAFESSASALGFSRESIAEGGSAQALNYQTYLDYMNEVFETTGGGYRRLEEFMQSAVFGYRENSNELMLLGRNIKADRFTTLWSENWRFGSPKSAKDLSSSLGRALATYAEADYEGNRDIFKSTPAMAGGLAYAFSNRPEDIQGLAEAMEKEGVYRALFGTGGYYDYEDPDNTNLIQKSPIGLSFLTQAYGRTRGWMGKKLRTMELEDGRAIPVQQLLSGHSFPMEEGAPMNYAALGDNPALRASSLLYEWQTRNTKGRNSLLRRVNAPISPSDVAFLYSYGMQMADETGSMPQNIAHVIAQMSGHKDWQAVQEAGRAFAGIIGTGESLAQYLPSNINLRGSNLAWFMNWSPGLYDENVEKQISAEQRARFMLKHSLGVTDNELNAVFKPGEYAMRRAAEGTAFEAAMAPGLAQKLGFRDIISGLDQATQQGRVDLKRAFEDIDTIYPELSKVNLTLGMTPDVLGLVGAEGEERLGLIEIKHAADKLKAEQKMQAPGYKMQLGAYANLLYSTAWVSHDPVKGPFGKLMKPWLESREWYQQLDEAGKVKKLTEFHTAAKRGVLPYLAVGYGDPDNYQWASDDLVPMGIEEQNIWRNEMIDTFRNAAGMFSPESMASELSDALNRYIGLGGNFEKLYRTYLGLGKGDPLPQQAVKSSMRPAKHLVTPSSGDASGGGPPRGDGDNLSTAAPDPRDPLRVVISHASADSRYPQQTLRNFNKAVEASFSQVGNARRYEQEVRAALANILGEGDYSDMDIGNMFNMAIGVDLPATTKFYRSYQRRTAAISRAGANAEKAYALAKSGGLPVTADEAMIDFAQEIAFNPTRAENREASAGMFGARAIQEAARTAGIDKGPLGISTETMEKFDATIKNLIPNLEKFSKIIEDTTGKYSKTEQEQAQSFYQRLAVAQKYAKGRAQYEQGYETFMLGEDAVGREEYAKALNDVVSGQTMMASAAGQLENMENQTNKGYWAGQTGRLARGLIGGWGLMYLQHLAQFPMSALSYGYQEAQQWGVESSAYAGAYGVGGSPFAADAYRRLGSQINYGGGVMGAMQNAGSAMPPLLRDLSGVGLAGLAGSAASLYVASTAAGAGATGLATLAGGAVPLVGALAAGVAGMSIVNQWRTNVPQTALSVLSQNDIAQQNLSSFSGMMRDNRITNDEFFSGIWGGINAIGAGVQLLTLPEDARNQIAGLDAARSVYRRGVMPTSALVSNEMTPTLLTSIATSKDFEGLDPTLGYQALTRQWGAGIASVETARHITLAQMRGIPTDQLAVGAMQAFRQTPSAGRGINWEMQFANIPNIYELERTQGGLQAISQLPTGALNRIIPAANQYQQIGLAYDLSQSTEWGLAVQQGRQYSSAYLAGREDLVNISPITPGMSADTRAKVYQDILQSDTADAAADRGLALGLTSEQSRQIWRMAKSGVAGQANVDRIYGAIQSLGSLGIIPEDPLQYRDPQRYQLNQMAVGAQTRVAGIMGTAAASQAFGVGGIRNFMMQNYGNSQFMNRLMNFEPIAWTQAAQASPNYWMSENMANVDINLAGDITGLSWGTTSLNRGSIGPADMATQIWGDRWQGTGWGDAAVNGFQTPSGKTVGGMRGLQWYASSLSYQSQMASLGNQMAMLNLEERYKPLFWDIEDRQRALGYEQTEWQFGQQRSQLAMSSRQFMENMTLNRTGSLMQRGWSMEDWALQSSQRARNWGWAQEDFQNEARFMSGRERRQAETSMERQTIVYNEQTEQIEKQQERQKQLWKLEDERFDLQIRHNKEQTKFQEDAINKQEEFYVEQKKLTEERTKLEREYWKEQMELRKAAIGAQAHYAKLMKETNDAMTELSQAQEDANGRWRMATTLEVQAINTLIGGMNYLIQYIKDHPGTIIPYYNGAKAAEVYQNVDTESEGPHHTGGTSIGRSTIVGERGPERVNLPLGAVVTPYNAFMNEILAGKSPDPWDTTVMQNTRNSRQDQPTTIIVQLGNEVLGKYVLELLQSKLEVM